MTAWSDPADLSTAALAKHLRFTDVGNNSYVLTYLRAQTHYAQLVRINRDTAVAVGSPFVIHEAGVDTYLLTKNAPEVTPALYVGAGANNTLYYAFVETDATNAYARFFVLDTATGLSLLDSDSATHTGAVTNASCADLGDGLLLTVLGNANHIRFSLAKVTGTAVEVKRSDVLTTWTSNTAIPLSLVRTGYRTGLLVASHSTNPTGLTLANAEAFTITFTTQALAGTANPTVTQYSGTEAELRVIPGATLVWNGTYAVGVIDATATPYQGTPFLAELDEQIFTEGPAGFTKALLTWVELGEGTPRLFAASDGEVAVVARVQPDGTDYERWQLITDALLAPVQVDLPLDDARFAGLTTAHTDVDSIAVIKAGAYYLLAAAFTVSSTPKLLLTAYKDDAALYGYVQDNQLRVIQRPLPAPGVLYPTDTLQVSQIQGLTEGVTTTPKAPANVDITSESYTDTVGLTRARVTFTWDEVTENTDESAFVDFSYYSVFIRTATPGSGYQFVGNSYNTLLVADGFEPGTEYLTVVYAVNQQNRASLASTETAFTTAGDSTPPAVPSAPMLSSRLGTIRIDWNGLGSAGEPMPADFSYVEVHLSTTTNFTPSSSTLVEKIIGAGYAIATDLVYGTTYYAKLVAVDTSGNRSSASAQTSIAPVQVQGDDIAANAITANKIDAGAIDGQVITGAVIQTAKPLGEGGQNARILLDSTRLEAYNTDGDATLSINANSGAITLLGDLTTGSTITGAVIEGGSIRIGSTSGSNTFKVNSTDGIYLGSQDFGSAPFKVSLSGALTASNATITGAITGSSTISIGSLNNIFKVDTDGLYLGHAVFSSAPFRVTMAGELVATNASISGNITANALAANSTIDSPIITGGSITIGTGESVFRATSVGISLGGSTFSSSPFRVSMAGVLTASSAYITGTINATGGTIGGFTIGATQLSGAGQITGGKLVGSEMAGGSIAIGNAVAVNAPFRVTDQGVVYAKAGVIGGWTLATDTNNNSYLYGDANSRIFGGSIERANMWALAERVKIEPALDAYFQWVEVGKSTVWVFNSHTEDPLSTDVVISIAGTVETVVIDEISTIQIVEPLSTYIAENTSFSLVVAVKNVSSTDGTTPLRRPIVDVFIDDAGTALDQVFYLNGTLPTAVNGWDIYTYTIVRLPDVFEGFPVYTCFANKTNYKA